MLINFVRSFVTFVTFNLATGPMLSCDAILFGKGFGGPKLPHLVVKPGALFGKGPIGSCSFLQLFVYKNCNPSQSGGSHNPKPTQYPTRPSEGNDYGTPAPLPTYRPQTTTQRPISPEQCWVHAQFPCSCQDNIYCAYNYQRRTCEHKSDFCKGLTWSDVECRDAHTNFAYGGSVCPNQAKAGWYCEVTPKLGYNMNGLRVIGNDSICYATPTSHQLLDPAKSRKSGKLVDFSLGYLKQRTTHSGNLELYSTFYHSDPSPYGPCLSVNIPVERVPGRYDLILKFLDDSDTGRTFDVKLNGITVLEEFNVLRYTNNDPIRPFDVTIRFDVRPGGRTGFRLNLKGLPQSEIKNNQIKLSFCTGNCAPLNAYLINGIAVLEYYNQRKFVSHPVSGSQPPPPSAPTGRPPPVMPGPPDSKPITTRPPSQMVKPTTRPPLVVKPPAPKPDIKPWPVILG